MTDDARGTIRDGEFHPAAREAFAFIKAIPVTRLLMWQEAFSSNAIEGNRLGEICGETLDRIMTGRPVSDRYVLGLAWTLRSMIEAEEEISPRT